MNVLIVQPPMLQLNTVYPSGAYLASFFRGEGCSVRWCDLNISLFYKIFSRDGITKLFDLTEQKALRMAQKALDSGNDAYAYELRRL